MINATRYNSMMGNLLEEAGLPTSDLINSPAQFFTLTQANDLQGLIAIEPYDSVGLLRSLVIKPTLRGQGLGQQLVEFTENWAKENNINTLYLLTTTAAPFFQTLGYTIIERNNAPIAIQSTSQFAGLCPASSTFMAKQLI